MQNNFNNEYYDQRAAAATMGAGKREFEVKEEFSSDEISRVESMQESKKGA